jgi:hypothetical protein
MRKLFCFLLIQVIRSIDLTESHLVLTTTTQSSLLTHHIRPQCAAQIVRHITPWQPNITTLKKYCNTCIHQLKYNLDILLCSFYIFLVAIITI